MTEQTRQPLNPPSRPRPSGSGPCCERCEPTTLAAGGTDAAWSAIVISNAAGYCLWPAVWIGDPLNLYAESVDLRKLEEEKYRTSLPSGITAKVLRGGIFLFDFTEWPPGRALPETDPTEA